MGRSRPRPWKPPGRGFRRIFDSGTSACWMRRENDGTVTCVVYLAHDDPRDGIWTLTCPPGAGILYQIYDKPWRVAWLESNDQPAWHGGELTGRRPLPGGPPRRAPKRRGRRRRETRAASGGLLPRKFSEKGTRRG